MRGMQHTPTTTNAAQAINAMAAPGPLDKISAGHACHAPGTNRTQPPTASNTEAATAEARGKVWLVTQRQKTTMAVQSQDTTTSAASRAEMMPVVHILVATKMEAAINIPNTHNAAIDSGRRYVVESRNLTTGKRICEKWGQGRGALKPATPKGGHANNHGDCERRSLCHW